MVKPKDDKDREIARLQAEIETLRASQSVASANPYHAYISELNRECDIKRRAKDAEEERLRAERKRANSPIGLEEKRRLAEEKRNEERRIAHEQMDAAAAYKQKQIDGRRDKLRESGMTDAEIDAQFERDRLELARENDPQIHEIGKALHDKIPPDVAGFTLMRNMPPDYDFGGR